MTPVSHFPVLGEDGVSIGLLSRDKISREMADLDSSGIEYEIIPEHLLSYEITDSIIKYFQNHRTIPVLNVYAQRVDTWEKPRFLAECSDLLNKKSSEKPPIIQDKNEPQTSESANKMLIYKYSELILQNFPDALFSTDKDGNTTFYNEKFEKQVLAKHIFRDSITLAEKYFKELNRDLISEYLKSVELEESSNTQFPVLQAYVKNIDFTVRIVTLKGDDKVLGFLYHLSEPTKNDIISEQIVPKSSDFISIEEAFED
jgi:PAS domain-containing protein